MDYGHVEENTLGYFFFSLKDADVNWIDRS